ncbi:TIGR00730 family Rossman fold protein [Paenibacillus chitinolyticus]|uniref:Cytokinin riboside 5'-monophosphate phosphoribohydrolase n=1 Tax=Paenibacillus chitinolyticus TaxID=79263 RepID=A0A410X4A3_9BACL|nr:TIGR00730 family Rossman fold protein [Paenibacillus chitinolyticus]MCY9592259.1 TIGR00730 family Rossman fold protein [Paenibacillus chitinolyticus]MCY9598046.1 TIGR00730 family Rossman fold protein [Paenibacillus chitinolyticus]QAV21426.1 TIGR00730 family Rossman fold protein [Paenibacillus chitinolyticus]
MKRIAVFCGSSNGASEVYREGAVRLGRELAERGLALVYGGASVGLMGAVADAVLEAGGEVIGVIPKMLENREISHHGLTELIVVESMHERKAKMAELADGFMALPGGPGTLEEFVEIYTWGQLGLHRKPFGLVNINHYYDPLVALFDRMNQEQFMQDKYRSMVLVNEDPAKLLEQFASYEAPEVKTYIKKDQT